MGQSVYFSATRPDPLSDQERGEIAALVEEFGVEDQIEEYLAIGSGPNWESFLWTTGGDFVFEGAVRLPDLSLKMIFDGIAHWGRLLGRIRTDVLMAAVWDVRVEDDILPWLETEGRFWDSSVDGTDFAALEDLL